MDLVVEGPDWRELVTGPKRDEQILRQLAGAVDQAARQVDAVSTARQPETEFAEGRLAAARVERLGIAEAKPLLDRLAQLNDEGERVLDMAPGITTGHDGVLVVTDRRLLFVGLRHTLLIPYERVRHVAARGKLLGARLIVVDAEPNARRGWPGTAARPGDRRARPHADRSGLARHLVLELDGLEAVGLGEGRARVRVLPWRRSIAEIRREHDLSETLLCRWRDEMIEVVRGAPSGGRDRSPDAEQRGRTAQLERALGRKACRTSSGCPATTSPRT